MCDSSFCVRPRGEMSGGWHYSQCWRHRCRYSCVSHFVSPPPLKSGPSNTNDYQTGSWARMRDLSHFHSFPLSVCPLCRSLSLKLWSLLKSIMHHGIDWPEYKSFLFWLTHILQWSPYRIQTPTSQLTTGLLLPLEIICEQWVTKKKVFTGPEDS